MTSWAREAALGAAGAAGGASLWWEWTAPASGAVSIEGIALPPNARFCMACGGAQTSPESRMRAAHLHGERKLITVLFADVVDSTSLAECMDPEDWTAIMNRAFERLSPVIAAHGGTIAAESAGDVDRA